ncbi:unnamed protein product [Cuscuta epithymum]|uniref:MULE transposase domain-containing protein n=1 Tax=Cuscuta epithymum TaxID=186058 RepID=A0AAV0CJ69_9ASTE|nr:unnamed protein product [Cuscuta epithymum]
MNANREIYPLAFGVVDSENGASWTWFLQLLVTQIIGPQRNVCIISDRRACGYRLCISKCGRIGNTSTSHYGSSTQPLHKNLLSRRRKCNTCYDESSEARLWVRLLEMNGMPCVHAHAVCHILKCPVDHLIPEVYKLSSYINAHSSDIMSLPNMNERPQNEFILLPPKYSSRTSRA